MYENISVSIIRMFLKDYIYNMQTQEKPRLWLGGSSQAHSAS